MSEAYNFLIDPDDGDSQLHIASFEGNISLLFELIGRKGSFQEINRKIRPIGATPLRLAVTRGHKAVILFLIEHGAIVDLPDFKAQTPLFIAVQKHLIHCMHILLESGANPDGDSNNLSSPVYIASRDGFLDGIKLLLKFGACLEPDDEHETSHPLHVALCYDHYNCFITLLKGGANPNYQRIHPTLSKSTHSFSYIPFTILKHKLSVKYFEAYIEFGGFLFQSFGEGERTFDPSQYGSYEKYLVCILSKPMKLKSLSRIIIRTEIGPSRLACIPGLPLPKCIIDYLMYSDFL